jgi:hypothetical protein
MTPSHVSEGDVYQSEMLVLKVYSLLTYAVESRERHFTTTLGISINMRGSP